MADPILPLIRRVLSGDAAAWQALWRRAEPLVHEVSGRACAGRSIQGSTDERRSVVVATMARIEGDGFRRLGLFLADAEARRDPGNDDARWTAWLATVATRVAIDRRRATSTADRASRVSDPIELGADLPDRDTMDVERRATARSVLHRAKIDLTRDQFDALLGWLVGDDARAIAQRLGLEREADAEKLVRAGIKRLRDRYRSDEGEEGMES